MNIKNKTSTKIINVLFLVFLAIASTSLLPLAVQAKVKVVFFCTDWNAKCREAKKDIYRDISKYPNNVEYKEFNIDLNSTPDQIRALGLNMPDSIPFIVIINKNGDILYQNSYNSTTSTAFETVLNKYAE